MKSSSFNKAKKNMNLGFKALKLLIHIFWLCYNLGICIEKLGPKL